MTRIRYLETFINISDKRDDVTTTASNHPTILRNMSMGNNHL